MAVRSPQLIGWLVLVFGCRSPGPAAPVVIDITTAEYAFGGPERVPAGLVTFRLSNLGREDHLATIIRLDPGESIAWLTESRPLLSLLREHAVLGGPLSSRGDRASEATLKLSPGRYALFCYLHAPDGTSHGSKGMVREFTVEGDTTGSPPVPPAGPAISLTDFAVNVRDTLPAGRQRFLVRNDGAQGHEVFITRIADGYTLAEAEAWSDSTDPSGPDPWEPSGGAAMLSPGGSIVIEGDFPPGRYLLDCGITDPATGLSHNQLGMKREVVLVAGA